MNSEQAAATGGSDNDDDNNNNNNKEIRSHRRRRSLGCQFLMPHRERKDKERAEGMPPKGCVAVRVGQEGEEQRRFLVPVAYVNHPLFAELLEKAKREYGFSQKGVVAIPCAVDHFHRVHQIIDREMGDAAGLHHRFPHFAGCFGA